MNGNDQIVVAAAMTKKAACFWSCSHFHGPVHRVRTCMMNATGCDGKVDLPLEVRCHLVQLTPHDRNEPYSCILGGFKKRLLCESVIASVSRTLDSKTEFRGGIKEGVNTLPTNGISRQPSPLSAFLCAKLYNALLSKVSIRSAKPANMAAERHYVYQPKQLVYVCQPATLSPCQKEHLRPRIYSVEIRYAFGFFTNLPSSPFENG